ncbi:hypothetical protein BBO99_00009420 [Phytophthora kernoviae]|uniref:Uncharacterized protein n=2 Tax=Phytophthora kernoviae TaxID=325452 RepID=A0A3R7GQG3_9STRA|nr:hypothetical protein G195_010607 [Phytophthora kernoviae 00238/432]KAG2504658.1 hypothetical protein JM16_009315 [Phytophthora kernoviae]KAG2506958.1 hypothetical protein JM18_008967 [Phytophthora kernoviae]RLN32539.1 hypothetical protein BBI17_009456 [Phytophthora kernoviae]RLN73466.1 hypothetical protein BBO99_00009420 [Phytophthora kernoviae]
MQRFSKSLSQRLITPNVQRFASPQTIGRYIAFFSTESPQMGKRLTPEEITERRAKRAARRGKEDSGGMKNEAEPMFIEGSVRPYQRHYVIVEAQGKDPMSWPAKLEMSPEHLVSSYMREVAHYFNGNIKKSPLLVTAAIPYTGVCGGQIAQAEKAEVSAEEREEGAHDILVFPECVRVHNVVPSKIAVLTTKSFEKNFDLLTLLNEEPVNLWTSSHYGGHRYAAACIVYPSGDWFGLLNDETKAKNLLNAMDDEDPLRLYELWRGRISLTPPEMYQAVKERAETPEVIAENA